MERNYIKRNIPSEFILRIENDGQISIRGTIEQVHSGQVYHFDDFLHMIMVVQQKLDEGLHPQCDSELRNFE